MARIQANPKEKIQTQLELFPFVKQKPRKTLLSLSYTAAADTNQERTLQAEPRILTNNNNMNKILFSAVIAALFCNVANAQTMKVGEFLKGQETTRTDLKKARKWQYRPDGQDFVCVNGENRYTRALYGSHDEHRAIINTPIHVRGKIEAQIP